MLKCKKVKWISNWTRKIYFKGNKSTSWLAFFEFFVSLLSPRSNVLWPFFLTSSSSIGPLEVVFDAICLTPRKIKHTQQASEKNRRVSGRRWTFILKGIVNFLHFTLDSSSGKRAEIKVLYHFPRYLHTLFYDIVVGKH